MSIGCSGLEIKQMDIRHGPSSFHNRLGKFHHHISFLQEISGNNVNLEINKYASLKQISAETEKTDYLT